MRLTSGEVLRLHARTCAIHRDPPPVVCDFYQWFMQDGLRLGGGHIAFAGIIPRGTTRVSPEQGRQLALRVGADLYAAATYHVTAPISVAMITSALNTPAVNVLHQEEVPAEAGFAWFDEPWPVLDSKGQTQVVRVITWRVTTADLFQRPRHPVVRVALYGHVDDDKDDPRWDGYRGDLMRFARDVGKLTPMHITTVPFGVEFHRPDDPLEQESAETVLAMFHLLWIWLGMEITATTPGKVPRKAGEAARRHLSHPDVRVVTLRKVRHPSDAPGTHRDIDWSCQWPVKGHHRHIEPYDHALHRAGHEARPGAEERDRCLTCGARVTWVRPHLKGPDGKPLRALDVVYKLAR